MAGTDRTRQGAAGGPAVVLVRPQLGENIGAAARAMLNFGLTRLRLVAPRDGWPNAKARAMASGADPVIDEVQVFKTTEAAVADLDFVIATTARERAMRKVVRDAAASAATLAERQAAGQAVGLLFGAERSGLTNDEVVLADEVMTIPANPAFSSLNLAQAVLLFGYEWFLAGGAGTRGAAGLDLGATRPATRAELLGFFEHLEGALDASGFLRPVEKRPSMVRTLRNLFHRASLTDQEVRSLRGVVASLTTYAARTKGED